MNCESIQEDLSAYSDGELAALPALRIRLHLLRCADCSTEIASLRHMKQRMLAFDIIEDRNEGSANSAIRRRPFLLRSPIMGFLRPALGAAMVVLVLGAIEYGRYAGHSPRIPSEHSRRGGLFPDLQASRITAPNERPPRTLPAPVQPHSTYSGDPAARPSIALRVRGALGSQPKPTLTQLSKDLPSLTQSILPAAHPKDDLSDLNASPAEVVTHWTRTPLDEQARWEEAISRRAISHDDFISVPVPPVAGLSPRSMETAIAAYQREKEIIDARLERNVTISAKATPFSEICKRLQEQTGVEIRAGKNVADDKTTIFCRKRSLRDIMRQINRVFGFTWRRDGNSGAYEYELTQDLRSQLLEEQLRNRDRDEALLAVDQEVEKWRRYRNMSLEEIQARIKAYTNKAANGAGKKEGENDPSGDDIRVLFPLASGGLIPTQLYFNLNPDQLNSLREGRELKFSSSPGPGELPLPPSMAQTIPQYIDNVMTDRPVTASLKLDHSELGKYSLQGGIYAEIKLENGHSGSGRGLNLATGMSPSARDPQNAVLNAKFADEPALRRKIRVEPQATCTFVHTPYPYFFSTEAGKKTSVGDVLEAIHKATGSDIVADSFTHLYDPDQMAVRDVTIFEALNRLSDKMRLRWNREDDWLQFRTISFFNDRLKEIPDRLLERWAASRREHGALTLDDLTEIGQLRDAQLDSEAMTIGVLAIWGLKEWDLARSQEIRPHWRFLGRLPRANREAAWSDKGLAFSQLSLSQRQQFIQLAFDEYVEQLRLEPDDFNGATLRILYNMPSDKEDTSAKNPLTANPVLFLYANGQRWSNKRGPFNAILHLPR